MWTPLHHPHTRVEIIVVGFPGFGFLMFVWFSWLKYPGSQKCNRFGDFGDAMSPSVELSSNVGGHWSKVWNCCHMRAPGLQKCCIVSESGKCTTVIKVRRLVCKSVALSANLGGRWSKVYHCRHMNALGLQNYLTVSESGRALLQSVELLSYDGVWSAKVLYCRLIWAGAGPNCRTVVK
jgi:hypothetical protein